MQRYAISLMLKEKKTQSAIAEAIGIDKSTISRELKRNSTGGKYHYSSAHDLCEIRKERLREPRKFNGEIKNRIDRKMRALVNASTDLLCIKENIFEELKIENGELKIAPRYARFFSEGDRRMLVIYDERAIPYLVDWLGTQAPSPATPIKVYVFSPGAYAWDDDFAHVLDRVELCALPEAIYQAYKSVLPKKRADGRCKMEDVREEGDEE